MTQENYNFIDFKSSEYQAWLVAQAPEDKPVLGDQTPEQLAGLIDAQKQRRQELHTEFLKKQQRKAVKEVGEKRLNRYLDRISSYNETIQAELSKWPGEVLSDDPPMFIVAHLDHKQVKIALVNWVKEKEDDDGNIILPAHHEVKYSSVILDAVPIEIIEYYNPLTHAVKYSLKLETHQVVIPVSEAPLPLPELAKEIAKLKVCFKPRSIPEYLHPILGAYIKTGKAKRVAEIEQSGFFLIDGKIVPSKVNFKTPTRESNKTACETIIEMQPLFYHTDRDRKRFADFLKKMVGAPFDFVRRQMGIVYTHGWILRLELARQTGAGKTLGYGLFACKVYRLDPLQHIKPSRDFQSVARVAHYLGSTTMPIVADEVDHLSDYETKENKPIISSLKDSVDKLETTRLTIQHGEIKEPVYAYTILTHNSELIGEDGFTRRFSGWEFTKSDKKSEEEKKAYQSYLSDNAEAIAAIGDFSIDYIMKNPDVLRNNWVDIGKTVLQAMFKEAEMKYPQWLDETAESESLTDEDVTESRKASVAAIFLETVNNAHSRYRYSLGSETLQEVSGIDLYTKVDTLLQKHLLPHFFLLPEKGVCIKTSIVDEFKARKLARVSHRALEDLCGFKRESVRLNSQTIPVITATMEQFLQFIAPKVTEERPEDRQENPDDKEGGEFITCSICKKFRNIHRGEIERHIIYTHGKSDVELIRSMNPDISDDQLPEQMLVAWPGRYTEEQVKQIVQAHHLQLKSQDRL